jgi:hypothetical protein
LRISEQVGHKIDTSINGVYEWVGDSEYNGVIVMAHYRGTKGGGRVLMLKARKEVASVIESGARS